MLFWKKKFFNSKIIYTVEKLENTEYQVQKIQLRTFINTFDHQSLRLAGFLIMSLVCK